MSNNRKIPYQAGYVYVDDSAKIVKGDTVIACYGDGDVQVRLNKLKDTVWDGFVNCLTKEKTYFKVVGQTSDLNIPNVPVI